MFDYKEEVEREKQKSIRNIFAIEKADSIVDYVEHVCHGTIYCKKTNIDGLNQLLHKIKTEFGQYTFNSMFIGNDILYVTYLCGRESLPVIARFNNPKEALNIISPGCRIEERSGDIDKVIVCDNN